MWVLQENTNLTNATIAKNKIDDVASKGFTLIELLVAIGIISILFATMTPLYVEYVQQGKNAQALATLGSLSIKMENNYLDYRQYDNANGNCAVISPTNDNFVFNCTSTGQSYTWTATSHNGNYQYTVNQTFNKATLAFAGITMAATDCWVISENGNCF